jgi:CBS domain containing-hemolysin-like protein
MLLADAQTTWFSLALNLSVAPVLLALSACFSGSEARLFSPTLVYWDDARRIVGAVNVYDVLTDARARPAAEHVRPPLVLLEGARVAAALLRLQRARQTMAIVQDRTGHCVGILTLKDLVEDIEGDLEIW